MKQRVVKIWLDDEAVYIQTCGGEVYRELFADYPRLRHATPAQRTHFEFDNFGIHWSELDEDLSYNGFMRKKKAA